MSAESNLLTVLSDQMVPAVTRPGRPPLNGRRRLPASGIAYAAELYSPQTMRRARWDLSVMIPDGSILLHRCRARPGYRPGLIAPGKIEPHTS
jgi:hypothetical protein